jgi:pimeloyl-ACP methyl ester carboxylesterase
VREEPVLFGEGGRLSGIVTDPPPGREVPGAPAIVIVHAGRIHRVGPNRIYVSLARSIAALGFTVLRFDLSGIGESDVRRDSVPFHLAELEDVVEAMDFLGATRGASRFTLMGICSGGSLSAMCALRDPRVSSAVVINAQGYPLTRTQRLRADARKLRRYWWKVAVRHPSSLQRLRRGRFPGPELLAAEVAPEDAAGQTPVDLLVGLRERGVQILIVYSESDPGLDYLQVMAGRELRASLAQGAAALEVVPGADHTFTLLASQRRLVDVVGRWLARTYGAARVEGEPAATATTG